MSSLCLFSLVSPPQPTWPSEDLLPPFSTPWWIMAHICTELTMGQTINTCWTGGQRGTLAYDLSLRSDLGTQGKIFTYNEDIVHHSITFAVSIQDWLNNSNKLLTKTWKKWWRDGWMDGWTDGWMGKTDWRMDGWASRDFVIIFMISKI